MVIYIQRRAFITLLGGAAAASALFWSPAVYAQQTGKVFSFAGDHAALIPTNIRDSTSHLPQTAELKAWRWKGLDARIEAAPSPAKSSITRNMRGERTSARIARMPGEHRLAHSLGAPNSLIGCHPPYRASSMMLLGHSSRSARQTSFAALSSMRNLAPEVIR
jgi:hypothetical protein